MPNKKILPEAEVGKPYLYKIKILGGRVFGGVQRKAGVIEPDDTGIFT